MEKRNKLVTAVLSQAFGPDCDRTCSCAAALGRGHIIFICAHRLAAAVVQECER